MHVLHGVLCIVWLYVWNLHYVCVRAIEEKTLGVFGCGNRSSAFKKRIKAQVRID